MSIRPIAANKFASVQNKLNKNNGTNCQPLAQTPSFKGAFGYTPFHAVPKSVLSSLNIVNLATWDRKIVCAAFDNIINEVKNDTTLVKTPGFQKLYEMYKTIGLRGMLHSLGQPNSENLQKIMQSNQEYSDIYLARTVVIRNEGPWGFFNNLFGLKSQNEITLRFSGKGSNISFSLDKAGDYQVGLNFDAQKWSYYANKDGVKKQIYPKGDLYLPPGV